MSTRGALSTEEKVWGTLKWISIVFFAVITIFPLIYMIGLSFKDVSELFRNPANFFPSWDQITSFDTYRQVLRSRADGGQGFWVFISNSLIVSTVTVVFTTTLGVLAAYAVARLNFFGKRDGLVHVSQSENRRLNHPSDVLKEGQEVWVKLLGFDDRGKVRLAMKMVDQATGEEVKKEEPAEG